MSADVERAAYLIRKGGAYYRPNERGYTTSAIQAGRYTLEQAEKITHPNGADGPRDGMSYIHEGNVVDEDWQAFQALAAERDAAVQRAEAAEAVAMGAEARSERDRVSLTEANARADAEWNKAIEAAAEWAKGAYACLSCGTVFLPDNGHEDEDCAKGYVSWDGATAEQKVAAIRALRRDAGGA